MVQIVKNDVSKGMTKVYIGPANILVLDNFNHGVGYLSTNQKKKQTQQLPFIETEPIYLYGIKANKLIFINFYYKNSGTKQKHHQDKCTMIQEPSNSTCLSVLHPDNIWLWIYVPPLLKLYHLSTQISNPFKWSYGKKRMYSISKMRT